MVLEELYYIRIHLILGEKLPRILLIPQVLDCHLTVLYGRAFVHFLVTLPHLIMLAIVMYLGNSFKFINTIFTLNRICIKCKAYILFNLYNKILLSFNVLLIFLYIEYLERNIKEYRLFLFNLLVLLPGDIYLNFLTGSMFLLIGRQVSLQIFLPKLVGNSTVLVMPKK